MDIWYFHSVLVVGSIKDCLIAEQFQRSETSRGDFFLASEASRDPSFQPPPFPALRTTENAPSPSQSSTLKTATSTSVIKNWDTLFPSTQQGDLAMKSLPFSLWETILAQCPLSTLPAKLQRMKETLGLNEDLTNGLKGILLHEWIEGSYYLLFGPLLAKLSEGTYIVPPRFNQRLTTSKKDCVVVYWRSCDWGEFADELRVFKNKKEISMADIKGTRTGPKKANGSHDGKQLVLDVHLPEDLWQYRHLFRSPSAFSHSHKEISCPPGYSWITFRTSNEKQIKGDETLLQDLRNVFDLDK